MTQLPGHIVAIGAGGFAVEPENPLLDDFILSLSRRQPARVCFVPTASGDSPAFIAKFYRSFSGRCIPTDLTLFDPEPLPRHPWKTAELPEFVAAQDIFYVGGGNTANLLALWRVHGLDRLLREAWMNGAVLAGLSAGMLCWFEGGVTDSFGGFEALRDGLGFLEGTACPHYDGEPGRAPRYRQLIAEGFPAGYAAEDGAALHFVGRELKEAVTSRPTAGVYRLRLDGGTVVEERIPTRFLGG